VLAANLGVPEAVIGKLPRHRVFIAGKDGPDKQPPPQSPECLR
jgi:hypothetical protein